MNGYFDKPAELLPKTIYGSIYNLGRQLRGQYAFSRNANIAIFFVANESVCVLRSKIEYGVIIKYSLPFQNRAQNLSCCIFCPLCYRHFLAWLGHSGEFQSSDL